MGKAGRIAAPGKAFKKWAGVVEGLGLTVLISFLFYRSVFGMAWALVIVPFWNRLYKSNQLQKKNAAKNVEFKEFMLLVATSLQAGYSVERALAVAEGELKTLMGENCLMVKYIHVMNQKIAMNVPIEKAFTEFAQQIDMEDAKSLADILQFAKRSGGDYGKHIRNTALKIEEKLMVQQEIDTMTSEKQLELKIMSVMPMAILIYVSITSYGFISPLYHNLMGVMIMSGCIVVYGLMIVLGRRLIWIQV